MPLHLGPGPVFVYDWLTTSRRWQLYATRAAFVGMILLGMALVWAGAVPREARGGRVAIRDLATFGEMLYRTIAVIEVSLVLLAAPAATAGAVCLDKARGTLDHMLATDLSNGEIVLGKLGVRLIPVLGLVAATLPVLAMATLLGGVDPLALVGLSLVAIGCAALVCSLAMVLSIYGRKAHEVLMLTYLVVILWMIAPALLEVIGLLTPLGPPALWRISLLWEWSADLNPYLLAFAPYDRPSTVGVGTFLGFLGGCLLVSIALAGLATARIRRVATRQAGRPAAGRRRGRLRRLFAMRWLPGPSLDANPVAWREWHRMRPSWMMRLAWGIYAALGMIGVAVSYSGVWDSPRGIGVAMVCLFQVSVGLLLLSVGAATSLAEERARGSLDLLLSTPMSTPAILFGKWWGQLRGVLGVVVWPAVFALGLAVAEWQWISYFALLGLVIASGAAITSLGLLMATWVARPGRAVAICATIYVVGVIVWPIVVFVVLNITGGGDLAGFGLFLGDPPIGATLMAIATAEGSGRIAGGGSFDDLVPMAIIWIVIYLLAAALLSGVVYATFDACLGRIPDEGLTLPRPPRGRSSLSDEELLAMVPLSGEP